VKLKVGHCHEWRAGCVHDDYPNSVSWWDSLDRCPFKELLESVIQCWIETPYHPTKCAERLVIYKDDELWWKEPVDED
jgi:hypothetical protein